MIKIDINEKLITSLKSCLLHCKQVDNCLYNENFESNESAAIAYLNLANSDMSVIKSIYYLNFEKITINDLSEIIHQFDVFAFEVTKNYATDHSHQWSNIEYEKFKELIKEQLGIVFNQ